MTTSSHRTALLLAAAFLFTLIGSSCRTFRGFGQDVEHAGQHIESASRH